MGEGAISKTSRMEDMPRQSKGEERQRPSILYLPSILQTYARMGHEDKDGKGGRACQTKARERKNYVLHIRTLILYLPSILHTHARMGHEDKEKSVEQRRCESAV